MPTSAAALRSGLKIAVFATVFSLSIAAAADVVRIGRYQSVVTVRPTGELNANGAREPREIPVEVVTRGEALAWILAQHGYQPDDHTRRLLILATILSAPVPAQARRRRTGNLHQALHALLGTDVTVMIDPLSKRAAVSISSQDAGAGEACSNAD